MLWQHLTVLIHTSLKVGDCCDNLWDCVGFLYRPGLYTIAFVLYYVWSCLFGIHVILKLSRSPGAWTPFVNQLTSHNLLLRDASSFVRVSHSVCVWITISNELIDCPFLCTRCMLFESNLYLLGIVSAYVIQQHFTVLIRTSLKVGGCYGDVWSRVDSLLSTLALHLDFLVQPYIAISCIGPSLLDDDRFFIILQFDILLLL